MPTPLRNALAGSLSLALFAASALAAGPQLAAPSQRISDEAIYADHAQYQAQQDRLEAINAAGRPLADYHLAKAQCWLDVSFHEYSRNDRSDFPQASLEQSALLAEALENGNDPGTDTPLVNDAKRLRPDLWQRLGSLHQAPGFSCAAALAACAEVELVHAGNEYNQQQWRHAQPYVQIAEELIARADVASAECLPPAAATPTPAAALPAPPQIMGAVHFAFDRSAITDITDLDALDVLLVHLQQAQADGWQLQAIMLTGHADQLRGRGGAYNLELSQRRADSVREWLLGAGISAALIHADARGDSSPALSCPPGNAIRLRDCLAPNRRVQISVELLPPAAD
ncbi:MAG: OmpA family protein [Xanthomonadales bacterium]|nr:OmpA family protein [Xanthomonadales bacterium]MDZ4114545.1 OmpA family protein [Xanthomonadaceae bacterium]